MERELGLSVPQRITIVAAEYPDAKRPLTAPLRWQSALAWLLRDEPPRQPG